MTKRPRPEECDIQWPLQLSQPCEPIEAREGTEVNQDGSTGKSVTANRSGQTGGGEPSEVAAPRVTPAEPVDPLGELDDNMQASAEVAGAGSEVARALDNVDISELSAGEAFWALLSRASYTIW